MQNQKESDISQNPQSDSQSVKKEKSSKKEQKTKKDTSQNQDETKGNPSSKKENDSSKKLDTNSNLDSNKDKQSKKEDKKSKKADKEAKRGDTNKQVENKPAEEEKLKYKKRIFNLTSYDEYVADKKEKLKTSQAKSLPQTSNINSNNSFLIKSNNNTLNYTENSANNSKKEITSKHIIKLLEKENINNINEELFVFFIKLTRYSFNKQGMLCRDLLEALKKFFLMEKNEEKNKMFFINQLKDKLNRIINIIGKLIVPIGALENTYKYIKNVLSKIPIERNMQDIKETLINKIDEFINLNFNNKDKIALNRGNNLIKEGDCILVYGKSKIFRIMFETAQKNNIDFKVIYVDNRQNNHIKSDIAFFSKLGINVTYSFMNGISGVIDRVTKVFIKAKSMLSNGNLLGELGTSLIACIAYNFKRPVIAFSETYKFWDKILMNSIQNNNILVDQINSNKKNEKLINNLQMLYDITPANYINMVVCELGFIPPTSVPVVIREFSKEDIEFE